MMLQIIEATGLHDPVIRDPCTVDGLGTSKLRFSCLINIDLGNFFTFTTLDIFFLLLR